MKSQANTGPTETEGLGTKEQREGEPSLMQEEESLVSGKQEVNVLLPW